MNQWTNESMKQWTNETPDQQINQAMDQWINGSAQRINGPMDQSITQWINEPVNESTVQWRHASRNQIVNESTTNESMIESKKQRANEAMTRWVSQSNSQWTNEPLNPRINESANHWCKKSMSQWINESLGQGTCEPLIQWIKTWSDERMNEWMDGWVGGELLLDWATSSLRYTSSLSYFFPKQPHIWARSRSMRLATSAAIPQSRSVAASQRIFCAQPRQCFGFFVWQPVATQKAGTSHQIDQRSCSVNSAEFTTQIQRDSGHCFAIFFCEIELSACSPVRIFPPSTSKGARRPPIVDNFPGSRLEPAEAETLIHAQKCFHRWIHTLPSCYTSQLLMIGGWHDDVVDMMVWMLTMTIVRNSEVSQLNFFWWYGM